ARREKSRSADCRAHVPGTPGSPNKTAFALDFASAPVRLARRRYAVSYGLRGGQLRINQRSPAGRTFRPADRERSKLVPSPRSGPGSTRDGTDFLPTNLRTTAPVPPSPAPFGAAPKASRPRAALAGSARYSAARAAQRTAPGARTRWTAQRRSAWSRRCHAASPDRRGGGGKGLGWRAPRRRGTPFHSPAQRG